MRNATKTQFEVWAQFRVSKRSMVEIHNFFKQEYAISPEFLVPNLHVTIYHSRRPMPKLEEMEKSCHFSIDTLDTRFMVLAPGGENPRPHLIPGRRKVGIRIKRTSNFRKIIHEYRCLFLPHETEKVLGSRKPSSSSRNAFGARSFQPHISILKGGSGIISNLSEVGENFREIVHEIYFDRFLIRKRRNF